MVHGERRSFVDSRIDKGAEVKRIILGGLLRWWCQCLLRRCRRDGDSDGAEVRHGDDLFDEQLQRLYTFRESAVLQDKPIDLGRRYGLVYRWLLLEYR